jgi:hypothetical protein
MREGVAVAKATVTPLSEASVPDYLEPIVGWRVWRVISWRGQKLLSSLFNNVVWFPETRLDASCFSSARLCLHSSPDERCGCGIYAAHNDAISWNAVCTRSLRPVVIGRVHLWGRVIEAERGWRATHAYPERIYVPRVGESFKDDDFRIAEGLRTYGVPATPVLVESSAAMMPALSVLAKENKPLAPA